MRKIIALVYLFAMALPVFAKPVDPGTALVAAARLLGKPVALAQTERLGGCHLCLGADGRGFVLLAADDCVRPLLAYSFTSRFDPDAMPPHVSQWIEGYRTEIASALALGISQSPQVRDQWQRLLDGRLKSVGNSVSPLLSTEWGQSPYYNDLCPTHYSSGAPMLAGCVATAMAQVMKYWNHPSSGRGSHSYYSHTAGRTLSADFANTVYNWNAMPATLTTTSGSEELEAVARLVADIGVAVDMQYSPSGSSAYVSSYCVIDSASAEAAFREYFFYNPGLHAVFKSSMSDIQWRAIASAELEAGHPLFYAGHGNRGGHAFVVDGFDSLQLFHINWGWDGSYNGYYNLDSLVIGYMGSGYAAFNHSNEMLVGVYPVNPSSSGYTLEGISSDTSRGTVSGSGTFASSDSGTMLLATAAPGYIFSGWASGAINNPLLYTPTADYSDTAYFAPLFGDTLGYCLDFGYDWYVSPDRGTVTWGIRIPMTMIPRHRQLQQVQLFVQDTGRYEVRVYRGHLPQTILFNETYSLSTSGWNTITLDASIPVYDTAPLWIVLSATGMQCITQRSLYTGNPDGSWMFDGVQWKYTHDVDGTYGTWLIKGIFSEAEQVYLDLRSNNDGWGSVRGGGHYYPGDTASIFAIPAGYYYEFDSWSDGTVENPYEFVIEADLVITAYFVQRNGIDGAEVEDVSVFIQGTTVVISNPNGYNVCLYDQLGRQIASPSGRTTITCSVPSSGLYLLYVEGRPAKRVVIIK